MRLKIQQRYGRLRVLRVVRFSNWKHKVHCICDCGNKKTVRLDHVRSGRTKSCGCLSVELSAARKLVHGNCRRSGKTREWLSWMNLIGRCQNKKDGAYHRYGGRSIKVCRRWLKFKNFLKDMGACPVGHTIERKNNNGNYTPNNCCWATRKAQCNNRRSNHFLKLGKTKLTATQWGERLGVNPLTLLGRIYNGWTTREALTTPIRHANRN